MNAAAVVGRGAGVWAAAARGSPGGVECMDASRQRVNKKKTPAPGFIVVPRTRNLHSRFRDIFPRARWPPYTTRAVKVADRVVDHVLWRFDDARRKSIE